MMHAASATAWCLGALAVWWPASGHACGACVEDKVAVVYDHAVVQRAAARGHVVVFCDVVGPPESARLKSVALALRGVMPGSVRVAAQPAALSFVLDARLRTPQDAVDGLQRAVGRTPQLTIVRVLAP